VYNASSILALDPAPFDNSLPLLPAIRALREASPHAFIAVASSTGICQLLQACGLVQEAIDLGSIRRGAGAGRRLFKLLRAIRQHEFDLVLDFAGHPATQLVARLFLRAKTVTSITGLDAITSFLTPPGGRPNRQGGSSRHARVLERLGLDLKDARILAPLIREEDEQFEKKLEDAGFRGGELLALLYAPGVESGRGWPTHSFAEIATRLTNNFGVRAVVADEPGDSTFTTAVASALPRGAVRLESPGAPQLVAAIARASVVVTTGEGVARIAEELGAPVVRPAGCSTEEVFDSAAQILQASRTPSLFSR
jgi:ADP-heptose:LPS heptosyltransferase